MSSKPSPSTHLNLAARFWTSQPPSIDHSDVLDFHRGLPNYSPTKLHSLNGVAKELGLKDVFLKDETNRLGLPAFKVLGASWGIRQAIAKRAGLSPPITLEDLSAAVEKHSVSLFAATDGNHGRAVARMGKLLGVKKTVITVPKDLDEPTKNFIRGEGATVIVVDGDYDEAVRIADQNARATEGMLIQDNGFEGYEEAPEWIVEGYSTLLNEVDEQLFGNAPDLFVVPVGVGSIAQAVVSHAKRADRGTTVMTVEPHSAACLYESLRAGEMVTISTGSTIMSGMNCGTVSTTAWPTLKAGVDVSVTISDIEAHEAVQYLHSIGIRAGPCGAATLAALRTIARSQPAMLDLDADSVVVLICTEGAREYVIPGGYQDSKVSP